MKQSEFAALEELVNEVRFSYIRLLNYHPDDLEARDGFFRLLLRFYQFEELAEASRSFLQNRKPEPRALQFHGLSQYLTGNYPQAEQDFRAAFGVGEDERHISSVDADGIALAAIQGLCEVVSALQVENESLKQRLDELEPQ